MTFNIHVHVHYPDSGVVMDKLNQILKNQDTIMASNKEIKELAITLQDIANQLVAATDEEQAQVQIAIDKLNEIIANGGTEAERQEILDILTASKATFLAAIEDIKGTIPDAPIE